MDWKIKYVTQPDLVQIRILCWIPFLFPIQSLLLSRLLLQYIVLLAIMISHILLLIVDIMIPRLKGMCGYTIKVTVRYLSKG